MSEALDLALLVEFVAEELAIDIAVQGDLTGEVTFVAPRTIKRSDLLPLLERLLDQNNFTLTYDPLLDRYLIRQAGAISGGSAEGAFATTRIIPTPGLRPSQLQPTVDQYSTAVSGIGSVSYLDELGVIVLTGPPIRAREFEMFIQSILAQAQRMEYTRLPLNHVSAAAARERILELLSPQAASAAIQRTGNNQPSALPSSGGLLNVADRLVVDLQSNSLIFRGLPDERREVEAIVHVVDQPTNLQAREFFAGSLASQVARVASGLGLGEVLEIDEEAQANTFNNNIRNRNNPNLQNQATESTGGSRMIVDIERGRIIHYGTPDQHNQLEDLVFELKADGERIVIREYKLENATAETVADLLQALVDGGDQQDEGTLLPGVSRPNQVNRAQPNQPGGGDGAFTARAEDVYVGFFEPQNMVLVKAPAEVQSQFSELIDRLDERSPQVYMEVQIVSVSNTENFRFAVESQLIAGQFGFQTNNGLSTAGDDFLDRRSPINTLGGMTSALIRSEALPFVINAIETETDARVISSPQLLVNDNAEATIRSDEEQPTTSTSQGDGSTVTSFEGFESAGTQLRVRPVISSGGYVRLEYDITLSNFIGAGGDGVPAPRLVREVSAESVTIPGDSTIVVGGINVSDFREEITGVPLLKDIPGIGALFSDTSEISSDSLLYIFITPRIMRDENFRDLRLMTSGPQSEVDIAEDVPELSPVFMESLGQHRFGESLSPTPMPASAAQEAESDRPPMPDLDSPSMMTPVGREGR